MRFKIPRIWAFHEACKPKMHFLKKGQKIRAWVDPPPSFGHCPKEKFSFCWCLPLDTLQLSIHVFGVSYAIFGGITFLFTRYFHFCNVMKTFVPRNLREGFKYYFFRFFAGKNVTQNDFRWFLCIFNKVKKGLKMDQKWLKIVFLNQKYLFSWRSLGVHPLPHLQGKNCATIFVELGGTPAPPLYGKN